MSSLSRRDFLKLASVMTLGALLPRSLSPSKGNDAAPNIIIILFDAMSARNLSFYEYPRDTTPFFNQFAKRSTVYHNHYSGGNFTTPGTACMLTGLFQWRHRAFSIGGLIRSNLKSNNLYTLLGDDTFRLMFSQNLYADRLAGQFYADVDRFLPMTSFSFREDNLIMDQVGRDRYMASIAFDEFLLPLQAGVPASSVLGYIYKSINLRTILGHEAHPDYPRGVPEAENFFNYLNEDVFEGIGSEIISLAKRAKPFFSYFHLYSPHAPYKPGRGFHRLFEEDGFAPPHKAMHPYTPGFSDADLLDKRLRYDQQIAHVDALFGELVERLESNGILDNSYMIVTSDHGEMFERGFFGHSGPLLYEPAIKIPLLIHAPGQSIRQDVHVPTSNVDLLPTLLSYAQRDIPSNLDGQILPAFGGAENSERPLFSMNAIENSQFLPLTKAAISMNKGKYKLIAYLGYDDMENPYEFYDLESDAEELQNLAGKEPLEFSRLKEEFLDHLADANRPYSKNNHNGG
jgi:arylsulfatase A-like enzyme